MQQYKLVIFDWDGTLMDSVGRIVSSMQAAAKFASLDIPSDEQTKQIIGLSLPKGISVLFPQRTDLQEELLINHYKQQYIELNHTPTPMFDHAIELLTRLNKTNQKIAVATGKGRAGLQRVWQSTNTAHFFHASRCAEDARSKPDPQMLTSLLAEFDVSASEAVMIGDTSHDMKMAVNAGIDRIGVTMGVHDHKVLSQYQPKVIVDSLIELQKILIT